MNTRPSDYKSDALPTELNRLTKFVVKHLENLSNDSNHLKNPPLGQPISSGSERLGFMWFLFRDSHPKTSYQSLQQSSIEHTQSTLLLPMSLVVDLEFLFWALKKLKPQCSWKIRTHFILFTSIDGVHSPSLTSITIHDWTTRLKKGSWSPTNCSYTEVLERTHRYFIFLDFYLRGQGVEKTDRCQTCALHPPILNVHSNRIFRLSLLTSSGYWSSVKAI